MTGSAQRRPVPQAPSTQMRPRVDDLADIANEATQHEMPAAFVEPAPRAPSPPRRTSRARPRPNSLPNIDTRGFQTPPVQPDEPDALGAETLMTPSGGAARRAWRDVSEAAAGPAQARFGGSAQKAQESSYVLDAQTDPELFSSDGMDATQEGIDATHELPPLDDEDRTHLGDEPLPASVRAHARGQRLPSLPELPVQPPPPADTRPLPPGPHGTRKLPAHSASGRPRPDTRTHSLESLGAGDAPPNEPTRLGELAGDPFIRPPERPTSQAAWAAPMRPVPVYLDDAPRPVPHAETIAAPGELAGLIEDLEARAVPKVSEGPPAPPDAVPSQALAGTPSMVRRGLASPLPSSDDLEASTDGDTLEPDFVPKVRPETFGVVPLEDTNELDALEDSGPPLEATRALVDTYDSGQMSMPGDALGPVMPRPLGRDDTGPMRALDPTQGIAPEPDAPQDAEEAVEWTPAPRARRLGAMATDGLLLLGLLAVPALLGLFGEPVAEASPIDPDDMSRLLMQGYLTLPLVAGGVLGLLYVTVTTAAGGRSLGKLAFGLQVIRNSDGMTPGFGQAFLRGLFALFGALLGGVGLFWPLVDGAARAMHDKVSGTTVVRAGSGRPAGANAG